MSGDFRFYRCRAISIAPRSNGTKRCLLDSFNLPTTTLLCIIFDREAKKERDFPLPLFLSSLRLTELKTKIKKREGWSRRENERWKWKRGWKVGE